MNKHKTEDEDDVLLSSAKMKAMFSNPSNMAIWRRVHDPSLGFPPPMVIQGRNFWSRKALIAFRDRLADEAVARLAARKPGKVNAAAAKRQAREARAK